MPADNIEGFRAEVIAALKQLRSGVYRFPGGNFVSAYEWRNAIGDPDKRPPIYDPVWHAVQPNDVGTDEFLTLCRLLGVDPYITVNAGFGDAWSARELVEYTNGAVTTPMGKWRAANGHPQPYNVKLWGIGNEPWGDYQMGAMSIEQFELKHEHVRQGHAEGGPIDHADCRRRHARCHDRSQSVQTHQRQVCPGLSLYGGLERSHARPLPGQHRHAQRALLFLQRHAHRSEAGEEGRHRAPAADRMGARARDAGPREVRALSGVPEAHSRTEGEAGADCHRRMGLHGRGTRTLTR